MDALASSLERSPELFPHTWDLRSDSVTLVRLTKADYETTSFLDERVLGARTLSRTLPYAQLAQSVGESRLRARCHFIFHIGHVGSTLLSRLLGTDRRLFALREPAILRTLARLKTDPELQPRAFDNTEFEERQTLFLKLWSRTFEPGQTALLKATSFASELAPRLLADPSAPKALLLFVSPEACFATILAAANAREEAKTLTEGRLKRLHRRIGREVWRLGALSEGEALAASWVAEMSALVEARDAAGPRAMPLDFDRFLANPPEQLAAVLRHFDCETTPNKVGEILAGPHMQRYSKAPEHAYSPELRREVLDEARKAHASEIAKGLAWLEQAARDTALVRSCLDLAAH
ncbi:MAG TPA: hypothetical protein VMD53_17540 [Rhizomicrobium sp.]|nr:hypothetical protein [Rhizomicrobium sp.]